MAAGNATFPIRVNWAIIYENGCDGFPLPVADGGRRWIVTGYDGTQVEVGPLFETVNAIANECYKRDSYNRTSGADGVFRLGCGFSRSSEFTAAFLSGYELTYAADGTPQVSLAKPGEDDCRPCDKVESEECDPTFSMVVNYCLRDCEDKVAGQEFMVIRSISEATSASRKRIGGTDPSAFNVDINLSLQTNEGWDYGPGDVFVSNDIDGEPACNSVTCNIACPADLDTGALAELCGCKGDLADCTIDLAFVAANPEFDIAILTG